MGFLFVFFLLSFVSLFQLFTLFSSMVQICVFLPRSRNAEKRVGTVSLSLSLFFFFYVSGAKRPLGDCGILFSFYHFFACACVLSSQSFAKQKTITLSENYSQFF